MRQSALTVEGLTAGGVPVEVLVGELAVLFGGCGASRVLRRLAGHDGPDGGAPVVGLACLDGFPGTATLTGLIGTRPSRARVLAVLRRLGVADLAGFPLCRLTTLQLALVAMAHALVENPDVLAADHPSAGLTTEESRVLAGLLRDLVDLDGRTVLIASDDPALAGDADHVIELTLDGHVVDRVVQVPDVG